MKAIFVFTDYADLKGLRGLASPGCRHCEALPVPILRKSNLTINNETKSKSHLLTDCFSEGSEQAVPTNDGYPEIVALKQVPRNDGYLRNHFP